MCAFLRPPSPGCAWTDRHRFGECIATRLHACCARLHSHVRAARPRKSVPHAHSRGRLGLTAARFKPKPLRSCAVACGYGRFGECIALRVEVVRRFGQAIGHAPVSREQVCGADRQHRPSTNTSFGKTAKKRHRRGSAPTPRTRLLILLPADLKCSRSRHAIPAEAELDNGDTAICSPITTYEAVTKRLIA